MAKKQKQPTKTCADCMHESACRVWTDGRYISDAAASQCPNHETVKESGAYLCGVLDERKRKQTKADRIRAMSDEELAAFMFSMVDCVSCQNKLMNNGKLVFGADRKTCTDKDYYAMCDGDGRKCESVCLEWLKQPAEGE